MLDVDRIIEVLRQHGLRVTSQRHAIVEAAIAVADEHNAAEELTAIVKRSDPHIHAATVYRTLNQLERCGIIYHVHLAHGPSIHHFTDHRPHHHAVCTRCQRVIEISNDDIATLTRQLDERDSFHLDPRHFALTGHCTTCHSAEF